MANLVDINPELAIYNKIVADTTLTTMLATYSSNPAVFFRSKVPTDATYPYIWTPGRVTTSYDDIKSANGESFMLDLFVVIEESGSLKTLQEITRKLKATLHRQEMTLTGGNQVLSLVSGPVSAPLTEDLVGTILTLNYTFFECPT